MQKLEFSVKQLCIVKSAILQNQQTLRFISVRFHYSICFSLSCSWTSQELRETRSSNDLFCLSAGSDLHALIQFYSGLHLSRAWCFCLCVFSASLTCSSWSLPRRAWRATWAAASLAALLVIPLPSGKTSSPNLAETVNLTERKKREEKDVSQTEQHKC